MKRQRNVSLLLMLVLLVAVGQMAQTIYIPAIAGMAQDLNAREGAVQKSWPPICSPMAYHNSFTAR
jgi:DHA1 family 2-module integral membrane pump EmrD-like MFS transporter